jgi:hypothetical protein
VFIGLSLKNQDLADCLSGGKNYLPELIGLNLVGKRVAE